MATTVDRLLEQAKDAAKRIHCCGDSKRDRLAALEDLRDEIDEIYDALKGDVFPMDDDDDDED